LKLTAEAIVENHFYVLEGKTTSASEFIEFWSNQYLYKPEIENLYDKNIGKPITPVSLGELFEWKNGSILSERKQKSIEQYLAPDQAIDFKVSVDVLRKHLCRPGGAIWRIFWLHIQHPERFPIFDQHVYRAMAYLKGMPSLTIDSRDGHKVDSYLHDYLPFVASFGAMPSTNLVVCVHWLRPAWSPPVPTKSQTADNIRGFLQSQRSTSIRRLSSSFCTLHSSFRNQNLDDLHLAADAAFAVDHLAALFGAHSRAETDFTGALNVARFVGIMHGGVSTIKRE
jgi:hypothetical protein